MATSAERRLQLESHLNEFRKIAEEKRQEKVVRWCYYFPAIVSTTILICQLANTIIFASFSYNFTALYVLLDKYMRQSVGLSMNGTEVNATEHYQYDGINAERIRDIDHYHDLLWTMLVAEVVEFILPLINIILFSWFMQRGKVQLPDRVHIIYLICPTLALILSISQACMIQVSLSESVYTIRFLLAKLLSVLLVINREGRRPIEESFDCEFFNDDDIVKPSCAGTIHDQVVSPFTLNLLIIIHILPVIVFIYLLLKNLKNYETERLFLYIENADEKGRPFTRGPVDDDKPRTLMTSIHDMLVDFDVRFQRKVSSKAANGVPARQKSASLCEVYTVSPA